MPVPLTLGDAADLTDVAIQKIFLKRSSLAKDRFFDKYYNVETGVTDRLLRDSSLSGLGEAARITENSVILGESPIQGNDQLYTQVEYGKLQSFSKHMWKFGIKKRDLEKVVDDLVTACERKRESFCADRLDNSFSTAYTENDDSGNFSVTISGGNTVALISNAQSREDGGTNNNNRITDGSTVNMDFDYDAVQAAHRTASLIRDAKGNLMNVNLDTLVVRAGHANFFRAQEILGAVQAGGKGSMPASADNDAAGIGAYKILALPWIETNTGFWWMFDSSMVGPVYGLQYKESQPIGLDGPNVVFKTNEIQFKATMMFDIGFGDYRNWVGSKNTNTA